MSRLERRIPFPVTIHLVPFSRKWNQLRNFEDIEKSAKGLSNSFGKPEASLRSLIFSIEQSKDLLDGALYSL